MQRIFDHLHGEGVSVADMQRVVQQLAYTQGMDQLLQELQGGSIAGQPCSSIILSDRYFSQQVQPMPVANRLQVTPWFELKHAM